jgi:hypothetical protein
MRWFLILLSSLLVNCGALAQDTVNDLRIENSQGKAALAGQTLSIRSETVYMKSDQMAAALKGDPGFAGLELEIMSGRSPTDFMLKVTRPFMTFNWDYSLRDGRTGKAVKTGRVSGFDGRVASSRIATEVIQALQDFRGSRVEAADANHQNDGHASMPASAKDSDYTTQILGSFETLYARSGTVYMQEEDLRSALQKRSEFSYWRIEFTPKASEAEVILEVKRPLFTFDWKYELTDRRTGTVLLSGKVTSWDGKSAASKLAASIAERVRLVRAAPGIPETAQATKRQAVQERSFKLSNAPGTGEIRIGKENISFSNGAQPVIEIPLSSVIAISYDRESTKSEAADAYWRFWSDFLQGDEGGATLVMLPIMLGGSVVAESKKRTRHNIGIIYQQQSNLARLRFEMHDNHNEVLETLQAATGIRWDDLTKAENEMRKGPEARGMFQSGVLVTEHDIQWSSTTLPPGRYKILLLVKGFDNPFSELSAQRHADAYILHASGFDTHPLARSEVEFGKLDAVFWSTFEHQAPPVTLSVRPKSSAVDEFQIGDVTFKVLSANGRPAR